MTHLHVSCPGAAITPPDSHSRDTLRRLVIQGSAG